MLPSMPTDQSVEESLIDILEFCAQGHKNFPNCIAYWANSMHLVRHHMSCQIWNVPDSCALVEKIFTQDFILWNNQSATNKAKAFLVFNPFDQDALELLTVWIKLPNILQYSFVRCNGLHQIYGLSSQIIMRFVWTVFVFGQASTNVLSSPLM